MSFVLPGNARSLRFTGEAKVVPKVEAPGAASLGKPRERKTATTPLPPPGSRRPPPPRELTGRDLYSEPPGAAYSGGPIVRHKLDSLNDDGDPTMALDRETHSVPPNALRTRASGMPPSAGMMSAGPRSAGPLSAGHRSAGPMSAGPMSVGPTGPRQPAPRYHEPPPRRPEASLRAPRVPHFPEPVVIEPDPTGDPSTVARHPSSTNERPAPMGAPYAIWIVAAVLAGILSYHVAPAVVARFDAPRPSPTEAP